RGRLFHSSKTARQEPATITLTGRNCDRFRRTLNMRVPLVLFLTIFGASATFAQAVHQGTSQEQQACSRDASRFCRKDLGNDGAVQQCLQGNRAKLSRSCKAVFESHGM